MRLPDWPAWFPLASMVLLAQEARDSGSPHAWVLERAVWEMETAREVSRHRIPRS